VYSRVFVEVAEWHNGQGRKAVIDPKACPPASRAAGCHPALHVRFHFIREFDQRSAAFASEFRHRLLPAYGWRAIRRRGRAEPRLPQQTMRYAELLGKVSQGNSADQTVGCSLEGLAHVYAPVDTRGAVYYTVNGRAQV